METPHAGDVIRSGRVVCTDLLRRGAKARETIDLADLILTTRYVFREAPGTEHSEIADLMDITKRTYDRRRARVRELTGVSPEDYPVDIAVQHPPVKVQLGLATL